VADGDRADRHRSDEVSIEAPGAEEVAVLPGRCCCANGWRGRIERSPRYPWIVPPSALYGLFAVGFTITILSVSVPEIAEDLGSDPSTVTWVITGPLLAFGVLGPAAGKLGDLHGHRRVYLISMAFVSLFAALTACRGARGRSSPSAPWPRPRAPRWALPPSP
jgi:hypothetical protein